MPAITTRSSLEYSKKILINGTRMVQSKQILSDLFILYETLQG